MSFTPRLLRASRGITPRVSKGVAPRPLPAHTTRRTYASDSDPNIPDPSRGSNAWIAILAAIALPSAYFLMPSAQPISTPADEDRPASRKAPGGQGSISAKQEGWSNADTDNPHVNDAGKSVKGEGETETAKVKGTVSTKRPQA